MQLSQVCSLQRLQALKHCSEPYKPAATLSKWTDRLFELAFCGFHDLAKGTHECRVMMVNNSVSAHHWRI